VIPDATTVWLFRERLAETGKDKLVWEELLLWVLGECIEVELLAADSQFESQGIFELLESLKIDHIIAWRRLKSRENPADVLTVKDRIDVEGPEWKKGIYKRLRAALEGFNAPRSEPINAIHHTEKLFSFHHIIDYERLWKKRYLSLKRFTRG